MVRKGNRDVLIELARKKASETYSFRKGKSRSKVYGTSKDGSPTPKRPKLDKELRDNRIAELNEIIPDLAKRIAIKESRCQQAEPVRNYKLCDELSEEIMHLKSEKREKEKELLLFKKTSEQRNMRKLKSEGNLIALTQLEVAGAGQQPQD